MYIHIGNDVSLPDVFIVAVFDLDRSTEDSELCREFLLRSEKEGKLQWLGPEIPRAVIISMDRVYLTPVRAETIRERLRHAGKLTHEHKSRKSGTFITDVSELYYNQSDNK